MGVGALSVGLATGIDYGKIIEGLINVEKQPVDKIQQKIDINGLKQQAYDELNGLALTAKLSMFDLASNSTFEAKKATSSNESVLTATASSSASVGSQSIQVVNLAASSVSLASGLDDTDSTAIGAGTLTFELGGKKLDQGTKLDDLNGGKGISRGKILITDSSGSSFTVDLSDTITVSDVIDKFNANTLGFTMSVSRTYSSGSFTNDGSFLTIKNNSTNSITLSKVGNNSALTDIGLKAETIAAAGSSTNSSPIYYVTTGTKLSKINDDLGIRTNASGTNDIRFYVLNTSTNVYNSVEVDLSGLTDVGGVINKINKAIFDENLNTYTSLKLSPDGFHLKFSGTVTNVIDINGSKAATDLGLTRLTSGEGESLIPDMNSTLLRNLNGGSGVKDIDTGVVRVITRDGNESYLNFKGAVSVEDINRIFNAATILETGSASGLTAEVNSTGNGFEITESTEANDITGAFIIEDVSGQIAKELGISTDYTTKKVINNTYDFVNDTTALTRNSTVYLDLNSLPDGITENDMVGKQIKHVYTGALEFAANTYPKDGVETAKILAFTAAPDPFYRSPINAALGEATLTTTGDDLNSDGTDEDYLIDTRGLSTTYNSSLDTDMIVGATLTVKTSSGSASSSIVYYDSSNSKIILADDAISTALIAAGYSDEEDIQSFGYTITYNHKIILEYPSSTTFSDASAVTFPGGNTFKDTTNLPTTIDQSRAIGATVVVTDSSGTTYTATVESITATDTLKFVAATDGITGTIPIATMNNASTIYEIIYNPIQNGASGSNSYLDDNDQDPDIITIQGVNSSTITGGNVEKRMMSGSTRLDDLNGGKGIARGYFTIKVGSASTEIDLTQTSIQTVQDLIDEINSQISSVVVELNDRGDGLRIYDITSSQSSSSGLAITDVDSGTAAKDLNIRNAALGKYQVAVTNNTDFASLTGSFVAGASTTTASISNMSGLNRKDVIGSTISFYSDVDDRRMHALVTDYSVSSAGVASFSLAGMVDETGTAAVAADVVTQSVNLQLKKHYDEYVAVAEITTLDSFNNTNRTFTVTLDDSDYTAFSTMTEEEFVGALVNFRNGDNNENEGGTGMITNFDPTLKTITVQADFIKPEYIDVGMIVSVARDSGFRHVINNGTITTDSGWLGNLSASGFISKTATVKSGTTSTVIYSDQFANLDSSQIIGALVTINSQSVSGEGNIAIVTGYDRADKSITISGGFYDSSGTADSTTLIAGDIVDITYASELKGAVVRSASQSSLFVGDKTVTVDNGGVNPNINATTTSTTLIRVDNLLSTTNANGAFGDWAKLAGGTITFDAGTSTTALQGDTATIKQVYENYDGETGAYVIELESALGATPSTTDSFTIAVKSEPISAALTNARHIRVDDLLSSSNIGDGSEDKFIGATIKFHANSPTSALKNESRTIVDIIRDYGGVQGRDVIVLDKALPTNPGVTDGFEIILPDIIATIESVDFTTGVITTREKMSTGMGNRTFNIHPVIDGTFQKSVTIGSADTLLDAVSKINAANVGVKASIINDGSTSNPYRLAMTASNSGLAGGVVVSSNITNFSVTQSTAAQDAKILIGDSTGNSSTIVNKSNTITNAINGVTINLLNTSTTSVKLTVSHDTASISEKMDAFTKELNTLLAGATRLSALENEVEVKDENGNTKKVKQKGIFFGDFTTRSLINSLKGLINLKVNNVNSGEFSLLSNVGFKLNTDGSQFEFDKSTFESSINNQFDQVKNLFTTISNISSSVAFNASAGLIYSGFELNDIRNGLTRKTGFLEGGSGTNGIKLKAGDTSKAISMNTSATKKLYGVKIYHYVPDDMQAEYAKTNAQIEASGATLTSSNDIDTITDTTYFGKDAGLIEDQLVGATISIGSYSSVIASYDATEGKITLEDNTISEGLNATGTLSDLTTGGYSITTTSGNISFSHNLKLEYRDPTTGSYKTYQSFSNVGDGLLSIIFPGGLTTNELRLSYDDNTGDSEDFTTNGYNARIMEIQVQESEGLGSQISQVFDGLTNSTTGSITQANKLIETINDNYNAQIERLNERIASKQEQLITQFQNLELIVSKLNSQSSYLQSQLNGLPKAFSARGGGG